MATAQAIPEKMTLDRADGSAAMELYRATLGPVHTDYYLKAFTRFDAAGKPGPLWNWTAALLTLNWLIYRQLWSMAFTYCGALVTAALLLVGIARLVFQLPDQVLWLLLGLTFLLAIGIPGAFGNVWLYSAYNKKMERALVISATLEEACAMLADKASGRKRMGILLVSNLAFAAMVTMLLHSWPGSQRPLEAAAPHAVAIENLRSGLSAQSAATANVPSSSASATAVAASEPISPVTVANTILPAAELTPGSRMSQGRVQILSTPSSATPLLAASAPLPVATDSAPSVAVEASTQTPAVVNTDKKHTTAKPGEITAGKRKKKVAKPSATASAPKDLSAKATATEPFRAPTQEGKFLINVGLFADSNNALNALTKLRDAGLPALSQEVKTSKGKRSRVRVGPYDTQVEADRAAEQIRTLQLEAVIFKP